MYAPAIRNKNPAKIRNKKVLQNSKTALFFLADTFNFRRILFHDFISESCHRLLFQNLILATQTRRTK